VNWTPTYYFVLTLVAGGIVLGLTILAAAGRIRLLWFTAAGLVLMGAAIAYVELGAGTIGQSSTAPRSQQSAGESAAGRNEPGIDKPEDTRAQDILRTEHPRQISDQQREKIRTYLARQNEAKVDHVAFSLVVGSGIPRAVQLQDLPTELADVLGGYNGDQYLLVRDQMVIVDRGSRRIVALIPDVA
jgi:hypothetical protein